jgi:multiple sugar transport system permease protein
VTVLRRALYLTGVVLLCAWVVVPIYLNALGAFGGRRGVYEWPKGILPTETSVSAMKMFISMEGVAQAAINSVVVAAMCMVLSIALGAPAGYALARFSFRGQNAYRLMILLTRAFPVAILALPLTVAFIRVGLYDTPAGVALVHTALALPFAVLVSSSLFVDIPRELEEAAWVFGCTRAQGFRRIVLPLALPGIASIAVFAFVISWNEVFAAAVLTVRQRTLTAYLLTVLSESPLHFRFAGAFLLIVPSVVFILAVRKYLLAMWSISSR